MIFMVNEQYLRRRIILTQKQNIFYKLKIIYKHYQDMQVLMNVILQVNLSKQQVH